jgi:hypothetical protein
VAWISKHERASIVAFVTACKERGLKQKISFSSRMSFLFGRPLLLLPRMAYNLAAFFPSPVPGGCLNDQETNI